jgi:hypothetical protein
MYVSETKLTFKFSNPHPLPDDLRAVILEGGVRVRILSERVRLRQGCVGEEGVRGKLETEQRNAAS